MYVTIQIKATTEHQKHSCAHACVQGSGLIPLTCTAQYWKGCWHVHNIIRYCPKEPSVRGVVITHLQLVIGRASTQYLSLRRETNAQRTRLEYHCLYSCTYLDSASKFNYIARRIIQCGAKPLTHWLGRPSTFKMSKFRVKKWVGCFQPFLY